MILSVGLLLTAALALDLDIPARQRELHVPAVSIAIVEDGKLLKTEVYGPINDKTVFQAASISKPVAATAALHMMQHGNFTLDEDVNGKLKSWKVPAHSFGEPVTLRRLLSHTAGLTMPGFPGYLAGKPIPTLVQILNGESPANTKPVVVDVKPGTIWRYSGGGYSVMQQLLIDRIGWTFPQIMERMVLSRIGMKRSTYEQPLPESWTSNAAPGHDREGNVLPGRWRTHPEMAAAGLWTTPSDLALWAMELRETYFGRSTRIIERSTAMEMLKPQSARGGLGFFLKGDGAAVRFWHDGSNAGYKCVMEMVLQTGQGAVIMTNGDNGGKLAAEILAAMAKERKWPTGAEK